VKTKIKTQDYCSLSLNSCQAQNGSRILITYASRETFFLSWLDVFCISVFLVIFFNNSSRLCHSIFHNCIKLYYWTLLDVKCFFFSMTTTNQSFFFLKFFFKPIPHMSLKNVWIYYLKQFCNFSFTKNE
jgi:hypothetical protein